MKVPKIRTRHFLSIEDLTKDEIIEILNFSGKLKNDLKSGKKHRLLQGKTLGMIFEKNSTRTRVSFETGIFQLGGQAIFLGMNDIQMARGESIADTARVLSRYIDAVMIRTYGQDIVEEFAANSGIPVINGLTDSTHPCQGLADFFTIYERDKNFKNKKLCYIGDGNNNVTNTLIIGAAIIGMNISVACPDQYKPEKSVLEKAKSIAAGTGANIVVTRDIDRACEGADYFYTDVWVSMGQEKESKKRKSILKNYKISAETLAKCSPRCLVMHDLPAHRGEEIDEDVFESERSVIFDQAENRLHVQKAILCALMAGR